MHACKRAHAEINLPYISVVVEKDSILSMLIIVIGWQGIGER